MALRLDHVPFGVRDVEEVEAHFSRLGFTCTPFGRCSWSLGGRDFEARCVCVVFAHRYLDFIEIDDAGWRRHLSSSPAYDGKLAPSGIVFSTPGLDSTRAELVGRGLPCDEPYAIEREVGGCTIGYRIFSFAGAGLPFAIIEDGDPAALRRPEWLRHANTAVDLVRLHLRVPDLERVRSVFDALGSSRTTRDVVTLAGATELQLHEGAPEEPWAALHEALPQRDRPALLGAELAVESRELAERWLAPAASVPDAPGLALVPTRSESALRRATPAQ